MSKTEIVGAANQIHPGVQSLHTRSRMPTLACQARQSLSNGSIQAFNKSGIEHGSPTRELEQLLCLLQLTVSHLAGDLHYPLFLHALDHYPNGQLWPHFSGCSPDSCHLLDLFSKGAPNATRISRPPIGHNE